MSFFFSLFTYDGMSVVQLKDLGARLYVFLVQSFVYIAHD